MLKGNGTRFFSVFVIEFVPFAANTSSVPAQYSYRGHIRMYVEIHIRDAYVFVRFVLKKGTEVNPRFILLTK